MSEHNTQAAFIQWAHLNEHKYPELKFSFGVPNAAKRSFALAARMKKEGMRKGVLDWWLLAPMGGFAGLAIEFKFGTNKLTKEQIAFAELAQKYGYCVAVCYSIDDAIKVTERYLAPSHC